MSLQRSAGVALLVTLPLTQGCSLTDLGDLNGGSRGFAADAAIDGGGFGGTSGGGSGGASGGGGASTGGNGGTGGVAGTGGAAGSGGGSGDAGVDAGPPLVITTLALPAGRVRSAYTATIDAMGGTQSGYSWTISSGTLPGSTSLSATGTPSATVSGAPNRSGTFDFQVEIMDDGGNTATADLSIDVTTVPWLTYSAIQDGLVEELYAVDATAASPLGIKLNGPVAMGGTLSAWRFSRDTTWLTYRADHDVAGDFELYAVDLLGATPAAPIKLSVPLVAGGDVTADRFSETSQRLIYRADGDVDDQFNFYLVEFTNRVPSAPVPLIPTFISGASATSTWAWAPNGLAVAVRADLDTDDIHEGYVVDLSGPTPGAPMKINGGLIATGDLRDFAFSPDSTKLAYRADQEVDEMIELYVVDVSGPTPASPVKLSGTLVTGGSVEAGYKWASDSSGIVYLADANVDDTVEAFYVNTSGPTPTTPTSLHGNVTPTTGDVKSFLWANTAAKVLLFGDISTPLADELFVTDVSSGTPGPARRINSPLTAGRDVIDYDFAPDNSLVVYRADELTAGVVELFSVDVTSATPGVRVRVNSPIVPTDGDVAQFAFRPRNGGNTDLVYFADQEINDVLEVFLVELSNGVPGAPVRIHPPIPALQTAIATGDPFDIEGKWAAFRGSLETAGLSEMFLVDLAASIGTATKVNGPLVSGGAVLQSKWAR